MDVEGKTMVGHLVGVHPDTNGGNFLPGHPDACVKTMTGRFFEPCADNSPVLKSADKHFFQSSDIQNRFPRSPAKLDDRIADQLARAVKGYIATPVHVMDSNIMFFDPLPGGLDVCVVGIRAQGIGGRMLQQQQGVW